MQVPFEAPETVIMNCFGIPPGQLGQEQGMTNLDLKGSAVRKQTLYS